MSSVSRSAAEDAVTAEPLHQPGPRSDSRALAVAELVRDERRRVQIPSKPAGVLGYSDRVDAVLAANLADRVRQVVANGGRRQEQGVRNLLGRHPALSTTQDVRLA